MTRPRILQIGKFYPPHMGGIETHLEALCVELKDRFDVRVVAANHRRGSAREVRDGIPVERLASPFALGNAPVIPGLPRAIRAAAPDVIHVHLPHPGGVLGIQGSGFRGPIVVTYHSDVVKQRVWSTVFTPFLEHLLRRARTIVATSPNYVQSSAILQRHRSRCRIVPYGISIERFAHRNHAAVASIRSQHGTRLILAVGRLVYYKGFEFLIRAMREIRGRLILIGDGPLRAELEREARQFGVLDRIVFLGELQNDEAAPYFAAADVFALPSVARSEAFAIVQLEAMASGTPVVNTALASGVPWVSRHGETGLTVPPGDSTALAAAINRLLDDPELREELGRAGRARVRSEFTVDVMADRIAAVYDEALGARTAPALAAAGA